MKRTITIAIEDGIVATLRSNRDKTGEPLGVQAERALRVLWGLEAQEQKKEAANAQS